MAVFCLVVFVSSETLQAGFHWPASGRISDNFYSRRPYGYHGAIDIAGPNGQTILAAYGGSVRFAGWSGSYGNLVICAHRSSYTTYCAHNSRFARRSGAVSQGTVVAYEGSTGHSTGPHSHFEIRRYGSKLYIPGSIGSYVTKGRNVPKSYPGIA